MDILEYWPDYRLLICKRCKRAIYPPLLATHLKRLHMRDTPQLASSQLVQAFMDETIPEILDASLLDPRLEPLILPPLNCHPFENLQTHKGYGCNHCSLVSKSEDVLQKHYNAQHAVVRRGSGGRKSSGSRAIREHLNREHFGDVAPWEQVWF